MGAAIAVIVIVVILGIIAATRAIKVVQQFEEGIVYRFGKVSPANEQKYRSSTV